MLKGVTCFWKFYVISQVHLLNTFRRTVYISVRAVSFQEMDRTKIFSTKKIDIAWRKKVFTLNQKCKTDLQQVESTPKPIFNVQKC